MTPSKLFRLFTRTSGDITGTVRYPESNERNEMKEMKNEKKKEK